MVITFQLQGKSHILVLFIFCLICFFLEIDGRVPGISTFEGLVVGSGIIKRKEINMQMYENE